MGEDARATKILPKMWATFRLDGGKLMNKKDMRSAISQAEMNQFGLAALWLQALSITIGLAIWTSSWLVFGLLFIGFAICLVHKPLARVISVIFALLWGVAGVGLGWIFESTSAMIMLGIIGFTMGLALNLTGADGAQDIIRSDCSDK